MAETGREVSGYRAGERVAFEALNGCGHCLNCKNGFKNMCTDWTHVGITCDGTFAEYLALPDVMVHKLPDSVSFADAAVLSPSALSCARWSTSSPSRGKRPWSSAPGRSGFSTCRR